MSNNKRNFDTLKVGKTYLNRAGDESDTRVIVCKDGHPVFPFNDSLGWSYTPEGRVAEAYASRCCDLVWELPDEAVKTEKKGIGITDRAQHSQNEAAHPSASPAGSIPFPIGSKWHKREWVNDKYIEVVGVHGEERLCWTPARESRVFHVSELREYVPYVEPVVITRWLEMYSINPAGPFEQFIIAWNTLPKGSPGEKFIKVTWADGDPVSVELVPGRGEE